MLHMFVSDFHIADNANVSDFSPAHHQAIALCSLIQDVEETVGPNNLMLYLLGDIVDCWQCLLRGQHLISFLRTQNPFATMFMSLRRRAHRSILVSGNHDSKCRGVISSVLGIPEVPQLVVVKNSHAISLLGKPSRDKYFSVSYSVLATHGDIFDMWNYGKYRFVGHAVTAVGALLEMIVGKDIDLQATRIGRRILPSKSALTRNSTVNNAVAYVARVREATEDPSFSIVIGHVHGDAGEVGPGVWNCGHWTNGSGGAVLYDDDEKTFTAINYCSEGQE